MWVGGVSKVEDSPLCVYDLGGNTCTDYTDEHGYAGSNKSLTPDPQVFVYGVVKALIRLHLHLRPVSLASQQLAADGFGGQAQ